MTRTSGGFLGMLSEGFSLPLVGLAVLLGVLFGVSQHEFASDGIEGKAPLDPDDGATTGGDIANPNRDSDPTPSGDATPAGVERALEAGRFEDAFQLARKTKNADLIDKARLFRELTRSIQPNAFAKGPLEEIRVGSGTVHVGIVRQDDDTLLLELPDGQEARIRKAGIKSRKTLEGDAASAAIHSHFAKARRALGDEPSGLALHRLSFLAIAAGQGRTGKLLLEEALEGAEGGILVDMFAEGEFERLHRARRILAGLPAEDPTQVALLDRKTDPNRDPGSTTRPPNRDPDSTTRPPRDDPGSTTRPPRTDRDPDPPPRDPDPPPRDPDPPPRRDGEFDRLDREADRSDERAGKRYEKVDPATDPALNDKRWKAGDRAYRSGLELYRGSFGVSPRISGAAIRAALKEFQRSQDQLNSLMQSYPDHYVIERRQMELNQLVIDCMKRQNVD